MQENAIKNYCLEDYFMYLSNIMNIPMGILFIKTDTKTLERPTAAAGNETELAD